MGQRGQVGEQGNDGPVGRIGYPVSPAFLDFCSNSILDRSLNSNHSFRKFQDLFQDNNIAKFI